MARRAPVLGHDPDRRSSSSAWVPRIRDSHESYYSVYYSMAKQVFLVGALVFSLYLISDPDLNAYTALQQHEPSFRIIRSLLQINLGIWCVGVSVAVYRSIVDPAVVEELLFAPEEPPAAAASLANQAPEESDEAPSQRRGWRQRFTQRQRRRYHPAEASQEHDLQEHDLSLTEAQERTADPQATTPDMEEPTASDTEDDRDGVLRTDSNVTVEPFSGSNVPSPHSIVTAALDNMMVILVGLFLFTITATGYMRRDLEEIQWGDQVEGPTTTSSPNPSPQVAPSNWNLVSSIAAPTFPLILYLYMGFVAVWPWRRKRRHFWSVVSRTLWAPIPSPVTFRDGFIGDIITSSVRPLQDLAFTFCYLLFGLKGWWSSAYYYHIERRHGVEGDSDMEPWENATTATMDQDLVRSFSFIRQADASVPEMEKSWLVHTVILPTCMISPLWWRFLQNLRQAYDAKARWPYLGNAFKYFLAAQVAMFGIYHPEQRNSVLWIVSYVVATMYQVWWDIFMDWGLLHVNKQGLALRSTRLYSSRLVYWAICSINVLLRFCWILTFLPQRYLNAAGRLTENFGDGLGAIFGPSLASAEIIRRSLWGLLRFEWEAIKEMPERGGKLESVASQDDEEADQDGLEMMQTRESSTSGDMAPMDMKRDTDPADVTQLSLQAPWWKSDMSSMNDIQILGELCLYATVFVLLGTLAAAHRDTL